MKTNYIPAAIIAATVVIAAMLVPVFANAAPVSGDAIVQVATVRTSDLDLSSDEGMSALKSRIAVAANRVCGETTATITPQERLAINACRAKARHAALAAARSRQDQTLAQR